MSWFRSNYLRLAGALSLVLSALHGILWIISRVGDIDFIISRIQEPGWVGAVIEWILNLPGWANLVLIVTGFGLLWIDSRRWSRANQPASSPLATSPQDGAAAPNRVSMVKFKDIAATEYGWDFNNYSNDEIQFADALCQAVIDGSIVIEGRSQAWELPERWKGQRRLVSIPAAHFLDFGIDLLSDQNYNTQTYKLGDPNSKFYSYRDLHLGDEAGGRAWLQNQSDQYKTPQPDMEAEKALIHLAHHTAVGDRMGAKMAFEEAARDGRLKVWGRRVIDGGRAAYGWNPLTVDYWNVAELDLGTFILFEAPKNNPKDYEHEATTTQRTAVIEGSSESVYAHLRVNRREALRLWPRIRPGSPLDR